MNNWTVLTEEEMLYVKGGMSDEDPITLAATNPTAFGEVLETTSRRDLMKWFKEFGYTRRQARRIVRQYLQSMGGC